jgi:site-specific DNA-cytosine methylase
LVGLVELWGGLCAGLEATLRNGWKVHRYVYFDCAEEVRQVARYRVESLRAQYPQQLSREVVERAFDCWPHDVRCIQPAHVQQLSSLGGAVVLWAGWECQDLSAAGSGKGLQGARSSTFFPLHDVWQQLCARLGGKFAYVLENTAMQVPWQRSAVVRQDYHRLVQLLGEPLQLDATQFGSRAHRLRFFRTNLAPVQRLRQVLSMAQRPPRRTVQQILDPGRFCRDVLAPDEPPFHCYNVMGSPR